MTPPTRFGISLYPFSRYPNPAALIETVKLLEDLGYYYAQIGEHFMVPSETTAIMDDLWYHSFSIAGAVFAQTRNIRILFGVTVIPYHHPVHLAKAIATLDVISNGRVILGAGVGWNKREFDALGVPFHERGARTDDTLRAIKRLWTSDTPSYQGRFISFEDVVFKPRPCQQPHPPIWVGGAAEQSIRRAAELGDGLHPLGGPLSNLEYMARATREELERRGRDPAKFTFTMSTDYGVTVSRHAKLAGGKELAEIISQEPDRALEEIARFRQAGYSNITVRIPARTMEELHDGLRKFSAEIMVPAGAVFVGDASWIPHLALPESTGADKS